MAQAHYKAACEAPPEFVWTFATDPARWVQLIPGYISHEEIGERRSQWKLQIDLGPFSRLVIADVEILELVDMQRLRFSITGSKATPFTGEGEVRAGEDGDATTVHFDITMTPSGPMGPVVNAIASPVLPRVTEHFAESLMRAIETAAQGVAQA